MISRAELDQLQDVNVRIHNEYRAKHDTPPVAYDPNLAAHAQQQAERCLATARLEHGNNAGEGQNAYMSSWSGYGGPANEEAVVAALASWYSEAERFGHGGKQGMMAAGHFTQVIWRETTRVGLGVARAQGRLYVIVNYTPRGNVLDDTAIARNVLPEAPQGPQHYDPPPQLYHDPGPTAAGHPQPPTRDRSPGGPGGREGYSAAPPPSHHQQPPPPQPIARNHSSGWGTPEPIASAASAGRADIQSFNAAAHNKYRAMHSAPPVSVDPTLAQHAQSQADACLASNTLSHGNNPGEGQNAYMSGWSAGSGPTDEAVVQSAIDKWYSEQKSYAPGRDGLMRSGHFTQLVWKKSTRVGVGIARGPGKVYVIVNYSPQGNMLDDRVIAENVQGQPGHAPPPPAQPQPQPQPVAAYQQPPPPPSQQQQYAAPAPVPVPPAPTPAQTRPSDLQELAVRAHNVYRRMHNAPDVMFDPTLAEHAQHQASHCLATNTLSHGNNPGEGQNAYMSGWSAGSGPADEAVVQSAVDKWYSEQKNYVPGKQGVRVSGHFTQLVWKRTLRIGLGYARGPGKVYVIVNYSPQGNILDDRLVEENVEGQPGAARGYEAPPVQQQPTRAAPPPQAQPQPQAYHQPHQHLAHSAPAGYGGPVSAQPLAPANTTADLGGRDHQAINVQHHNDYRARHNSPPVLFDPTLAQHAQAQADACLASNTLSHGNNPKEGQNAYMSSWSGGSGPTDEDVIRAAIDKWYGERSRYQGGRNGLRAAGHFTQVVWKASTKVGLGLARGPNKVFIIVNYSPQGNIDDDQHILENVVN